MSLSHKKLAKWYLQLAQSLESGLALPAALETCAGAPAVGRVLMANNLVAGLSIDDTLKQAPGWLPKKDRYFWSAAAHSGRLPQTLRTLSDQHERLGSAKLKLMFGALYPVGILTFAGFLIPIMWQLDFENGLHSVGELFNPKYFLTVAAIEGTLWGSIALLLILAKLDSPLLPLIAKVLPGFRGHAKNQALADFSYALGAFLEAGTPIAKAWAGAGMVSNSNAIKHASNEMRRKIDDGATPSEHLPRYRCFPDDFRALYTTGERTGQLEKNLVVLGRQFQTSANHAMTFAAVFYPVIMFAVVAVFMVYNIIKMYSAYLSGLTDMMK